MVEAPIAMAQSQEREISIPGGPEDRCRQAFLEEWERLRVDDQIYQLHSVARCYGIGSLAIVCEKVSPDKPIPFEQIANLPIAFSVFDPLNTAGSLVLNQDPNAIDFMKFTSIAVSGIPYHRSRTVTVMNERPVYISYTTSAFGFVGRSVFQRALFPLKSFVQSMVTDDLVTKKAGVFIAKLESPGSIIDNLMQRAAGIKRLFVKQSTNGNVISIGKDEDITTLNMQNIDGAYGMARTNLLKNIATSADMPAVILENETLTEGFGEGTEDAKLIAGFVHRFRKEMRPTYKFFDEIVMRRAWNRDFYKSIQEEFPEYGGVRYEEALYRWMRDFNAVWPSLLIEPESKRVETDKVKLEGIMSALEVFGPMLDPENRAELIRWAQDNINENKVMFKDSLDFDIDALKEWNPQEAMLGDENEPSEPKPLSITANDSQGRRRRSPRMRRLDTEELEDLITLMTAKPLGLPKPNGHMNGSVHQ